LYSEAIEFEFTGFKGVCMEFGHFLQICLISAPPHIFRYCTPYYVRISEITDETIFFSSLNLIRISNLPRACHFTLRLSCDLIFEALTFSDYI